MFWRLDASRAVDPDAVSGDEVSRLNSAQMTGPGISLPVYPGDEVDMQVYAYHRGGSGYSTQPGLDAFIASVAGAFGGVNGGSTTEQATYNTFNNAINPASGGIGLQGTDQDTRPAAYLNYILFDKNFKVAQHGHAQIGSTANNAQQLSISNIVSHVEGFIYIYLSNESNTLNEVYFDNFEITLNESKVIQSNDYYPFGLQHNTSWTRMDQTPNAYKFNGGSEYNEGLGVYETAFRQYDPALGRFMGVDAMAGRSSSWSPYSFGFNNPVVFNDPIGLYPSKINPFDKGSGPLVEGYGWGGFGYGPIGRDPSPSLDYYAAKNALRNLYVSKNGGSYSAGSGTSYYGPNDTNIAIAAGYAYNQHFGTTAMLANSMYGKGRTLEQYKVDGQYIHRDASGQMYVPYTNIPMSAVELVKGMYTADMVSLRSLLETNTEDYTIQPQMIYASVAPFSEDSPLREHGVSTLAAIAGIANGVGTIATHNSRPIYTGVMEWAETVKGATKLGRRFGYVGLALTAIDMGTNGINTSNSLDATFGVVGFCGPVGAIVSGVYFVGNLMTTGITGRTIGEHADDYYWVSIPGVGVVPTGKKPK